MHRAHFPHRLLPWLLVAPQLLISAVFFYWPAGQALWQSMLREDAFGLKSTFVGFANFRRVLSDPAWLNAIQVTAVFSLLTAFFSMAIALFLAVQAEKVVRGRAFYRTLMIWPYAVAPAIAGMLWLFMFNPSFGTLAWPLRQLGIRWDPLLDGEQAMTLVVAAASWKQISYNFLFFVAGLQAIPRSLLEAAAIDGASARRRFWTITFPLLAPTTFFLLVVNSVYALFDTFGIIHAVTGGGPGKSTETLVYKVYNDGFVNLRFGDSAAQSVILMGIVIALTAFQFKYIERKVHYG
ncbi:sn-glycerol-3-phosphate ABC transporter permease UgpA [Cereibacter johrii]|uniref:sn-glycerol-3-phosphate transport system permease protein UgpA n=1 Tax=Cereibacter johrii TaxID=445629 RepID=A0ABX5JB36_9RHOB|nr:sn-glycerol-3-phosphate ABC transporter permease UgpA [Cereibacter johrii]ODM43893.1 glycerol-3-phosphate transporter permease [Cereibacter johrii]PTM78323.1 carbohydrate ABC transporter membrane protein 1 (CUT1 family) [Cereibacter johrii]